jgi:nucleoside-diphosphate-sugar epimerase
MKYIVTGGAGFIGSHIAEELARQGHETVVIDNLFSGRETNIAHIRDRITFVRGSILDLPLLRKTFAEADGVFHEAAIASVPRSIADPLATNEANISGTLQVAVAARDCGVRKIVFASSSSVYGDSPTLPKSEGMAPDPISPYAVSKLAGEQYLGVFSRIYGLSAVSLRYFNVFGPRQDPRSEYAAVIPKFITKILGGKPPVIYGDGSQSRDFTYVRDVVQANVKAMSGDAQGIFNIACHRRTTLLELARTIMDICGTEVTPIHDPPRPGDVRHSLADIDRAGTAFGYSPGYSLETGLAETIHWFGTNRGQPE